mgnify:FL=1
MEFKVFILTAALIALGFVAYFILALGNVSGSADVVAIAAALGQTQQ